MKKLGIPGALVEGKSVPKPLLFVVFVVVVAVALEY